MTRPLRLGALLAALPASATAQEVTFTLDETLTVAETEVPYVLDLTLRAAGQTRLEADAVLDLRDFQASLPERLAGRTILDVCGNRTVLSALDVSGEADAIRLEGGVTSEFFECGRTGETGFERGDPRETLGLAVSAAASAKMRDNCIVFEIADLRLTPDQRLLGDDAPLGAIEIARTLLLEAVAAILDEMPFCPKLPPELSSLDPSFTRATPQEVGGGGLGVSLSGSVDVSPSTILDILNLLQNEGRLPGRP